MTARRALNELATVQMVESEIDDHVLYGPTEGSEAARTILEAPGLPSQRMNSQPYPPAPPNPPKKLRVFVGMVGISG